MFPAKSQGETAMASFSITSTLLLFILLHTSIASSAPSYLHATIHERGSGTESSAGRRVLLSFKETPRGSNVTFECSPSGPCVPCLYPEKNKGEYRCSETGYRIPFKCVEVTDGSQTSHVEKTPNGRSTLETSIGSAKSQVLPHDDEEVTSSTEHRSLSDASSASKEGSQSYITYRSCVPAADEEKLSVIGFEGIVLGLLLISGTVIYMRRKRTIPMPGVATGRMQSNSRF